MAIVHQSDLTSFARCPQAFMFSRSGAPRKQLSPTAYGSVVHYALETFERLVRTEGVEYTDAVEAAVRTFEHYWHPLNIDAITQPVDVWTPRAGYSELRFRGIESIRTYCTMMKLDDHQLLATEYGFQVPIKGTLDEDTGEPHILAGTLDRLALRKHTGKPYVSIEDFKTGKQSKFLRQNLQFTAYCYASTRPEFWNGWQGEDGFGARGPDLHQRTRLLPRRGTWIDMRNVKRMDAGWRGPDDFRRFALAVEQLVASMRADIYPLSISGENCQYCDFRDVCGGSGIPEKDHGAPR